MVIKKGQITYDQLSELDVNKPLKDQIDSLTEDMLQVEYPNNIILDVGWYPSFSIDGEFVVSVIQDFDWGKPLKEKRTKVIAELIEILRTIDDELAL